MRAGPQQAKGFNAPLCRILAYKVVALYSANGRYVYVNSVKLFLGQQLPS
jgi:hypothetical protein